jgi:hypothetical protein
MNHSNKHLHIIAFAVPNPPLYGGTIDVYHKIRTLSGMGIKIHLHAFTYKQHKPWKKLAELCESVNYYPRKNHWIHMLSRKPYIVKTRMDKNLLKNLQKDGHPILFEGLHTCSLVAHPSLKQRFKIYRESNIEHHYYYHLFKAEKGIGNKIFHLTESFKLWRFQRQLKHVQLMLAVSRKDTQYLKKHFPDKDVFHLPSFHPHETINTKPGQGDYALYHGKLEVAENHQAATFLIKKVFNQSDIPLIIAGMNAPPSLRKLINTMPLVTLVENPDDITMTKLIREAQVHILVTFQATGLKLKLLNTLYNGRHILVNPAMVAGTLAENICETGKNPLELKTKLRHLMKKPFDMKQLDKRKTLLEKYYNNKNNGQQLINMIFREKTTG